MTGLQDSASLQQIWGLYTAPYAVLVAGTGRALPVQHPSTRPTHLMMYGPVGASTGVHSLTAHSTPTHPLMSGTHGSPTSHPVLFTQDAPPVALYKSTRADSWESISPAVQLLLPSVLNCPEGQSAIQHAQRCHSLQG